MVLNIGSFFQGQEKVYKRPLINQFPIGTTAHSSRGISTNLTQKTQFWRWFRTRPELNSPVSIRVDDTITDVDFFAPDGTTLGRNKRMESEKFWEDNQLHERFKSVQFDRLTTGSGFFWIGKLSEKQLKEICRKVTGHWNLKELPIIERLLYKAAKDEDLRKPRVVDYVASSTVQIEHDRFDVTRYIQQFSGWTAEFDPKDIVHIPLHRIDGKVDGFTPIESLWYELTLLWAIKENMLAYMRNGGVPSRIFVLPDEIANSDNHQWLTQVLMDKGVLENRHGNLVLTGNVDVKELEEKMKDMEYKELALYVTSNIAFALRVPVTRIPYLIGSAATKSDGGGMAEQGYWSMIDSDMRTLEIAANNQIFRKLGFIIKFKRRYKLDDLREAQALNFKVDALTKVQLELKNQGLKLTKDKLREILDLSSNDTEKMTSEEMMSDMEKTGLLNRSFAKDDETGPDMGKQNANDTKRQAAKNNPKGANQTGV